MDRSSVIFGNPMPRSVVRKANRTKEKFLRRFGDDSRVHYTFAITEHQVLSPIGTRVLTSGEGAVFGDRSVIIGNIRMGFGHYRISMAMASCAHALGYEPLWLDLNAFPESVCTKMISYQNNLYSM